MIGARDVGRRLLGPRLFLKFVVGNVVIVDRCEAQKARPFGEIFVEKEMILADAGERESRRVQNVVLRIGEGFLRGVDFIGGRCRDAE